VIAGARRGAWQQAGGATREHGPAGLVWTECNGDGSVQPGVRSIGYDRSSRVLEIEFVRGRVYRYFDVPVRCFEETGRGGLEGIYVNTIIKPRFRYQKVARAKALSRGDRAASRSGGRGVPART
jgi:hypothetical protein